MRCIKGEEWPTTSFDCVVSFAENLTIENAVTFSCPVGHTFSLRQALRKKIFTEQQVWDILARAQQQIAEGRKKYAQREKERWRMRPSDYVPNKKIVAKNWTCVRCEKKAANAPRFEEHHALCLECMAAWDNYEPKQFEILLNTSGRARDLGWDLVFQRFLRNDPPLNPEEAEEFLQAHRKQARRESQERSRLKKKPRP